MANSSWIYPADPKSNYHAHQKEIDEAIQRVLEDGHYILGPEVAAFEAEFARYVGTQFAIGVASGTDALQLALRACGIGPGDAVITVSHTAVATVASIELAGALPVLIDIQRDSFNLDPNQLEKTIERHNQSVPSARIKAILPVHLYGRPADMPAIMDIAARHDLIVIEDCSQSHGAAINDRKTGTWGRAATFSFYPTKNLGAIGDGGAVVTNDPAVADRARVTREYGWRERYISDSCGTNSRLDELQAAILRVKLKYLDEQNARRRKIAAQYDELLALTTLRLPQTPAGLTHVYHQYVIRSEQRNRLQEFLKSRKIGTLIHYPLPVHLQPAYCGRLGDLGSLPETECAAEQILSLPLFPEISSEHVSAVAEAILDFDRSSN